MSNSLETGGSERQFATLAGALPAHSFRVRLGCFQGRGGLLEEIGEFREFPLGGSFLTATALRSHLALRRYLRAERIAVAHAFDFYTNLMLLPTARLARVPVVIGSHRQIGDLLTPWQFRAQAVVLRLCDRVVCNSRAAARALLEQGLPEAKLTIIPNAIPDEVFAEAMPALARRTEGLRVGMIARMNNAVKNHPVFLRAAARLAEKFPTVEFVLAGDGPLRPGLERMARDLGIADRVLFLGDRRDIPAVFRSLDVSVLPSLSESLPNAVLESMAAGVPVVATRVGGNPEAVVDGETGLLIPPHDEDALVTALDLLLAQPSLRTQYGRQAKQVARANFGLAQICARFDQLYRSLLEEKGWRHQPLARMKAAGQPIASTDRDL
jgi:glycosyltransferase involved in cell wall biosynthesis